MAGVRTVTDVLAVVEQFPTLARLTKERGSGKVEALIKLYLVELSELVNLKRPLTEKQIDRIAAEVLDQYSVLTVADVHLIFRNAINGKYGDFFEGLDVPKVLKWFSSYFSERCAAAAEMSEAGAFYDKGGNVTAGYAAKQLDDLAKKYKKNY